MKRRLMKGKRKPPCWFCEGKQRWSSVPIGNGEYTMDAPVSCQYCGACPDLED